jgi:hypothetical protein
MAPAASSARLHPDLLTAVRASSFSRSALAEFVGFAHLPNFSAFLHADAFRLTPTLIERAEKLAALLRYDGPLFETIDKREGAAR